MINKIFFIISNLIFNNKIIFNFFNYSLKNVEYNFNFFNINFENDNDLKKIILSKKYFENKYYDEKSIIYHNFDWLNTAKNIGGSEIVSLCKKHIINWYNQKYNTLTIAWDNKVISKRLINMIYNFDFYAVSATDYEKKIIKSIIVKQYLTLRIQIATNKNYLYSIINLKAVLLFNLINNLDIKKIVNLIKDQINKHIK